ncbi:MAG: hypothetical protein WKF58_03165 [Ilumatobacteraceae bacterium]
MRTFASATARSCSDADRYAASIAELNRRWHERLGRVRAGSAAERPLALLGGVPVITVDAAARLIERSTVRTGEAIKRLESAGVLRQRNVGRQRYRVFEAPDVIDLFAGLERALASQPATPQPRRRPGRRQALNPPRIWRCATASGPGLDP